MENASETTAETVVETVEVKTEAKTPKKKASEKLFPVKLLKNYRPVSIEAQIQDEDSSEYRAMSEEEAQKVRAGQHIALPVQEAKDVIANRIAERNDPVA